VLTRILVVDDSASDRLIIQTMLNEHDILIACDGLEALELLQRHEDIDLMILDLNMPKMDGFEVLEKVAGDERLKKLRTIILTNYDELENEMKGLQLGAVDYVRKPIHMESLKARIGVHVELLRVQRTLEKALNKQSAALETLFKQIPVGIAVSYGKDGMGDDFDERFGVNPAFEELTGRSKDELLKVGWEAITHPDDLEEEVKNFERLKTGEVDVYAMDKRFIRPDGSIVWVHLITAALAKEEGSPLSYISMVSDISERKMIEEKLVESERSKSVLLSHLPGMAYRCNYDRDWTMKFVSTGCLELTGYSEDDLIDNKELSFNDLIAPEHRELLWEEWARTVAERIPFRREYEITTAQGVRKWVYEIGQAVYNSRGQVEALEGIIIDISERKDMENKLRYINEHDEWTGLYNRRYLESVLTEELNEMSEMSLGKRALIGVNASAMHSLSLTYGSQYSHDLTKRIADELMEFCSDQCLLFNTHEHRFAFYKKGYQDRNELIDFCDRVSERLSSLLAVDRINVGMGVVEIEKGRRHDVELLLKNLLITSEEALVAGDKDNFLCFYDHALEERIFRRETLQHDLSNVSMGEGADGLILQFQPILDLRENCICGFEALARYNSDLLGLVSPLEFIPIIEKTKHIVPIGHTIMKKACQFVHMLKANGFPTLSVSVNVSAVQLLSKGFVESVLDLLREMRVNPELIVLELTESAFSSDYDEINRVLGILRAHV
jgi:PAS domain S-box-containing protein